jgi:hypothetical protein
MKNKIVFWFITSTLTIFTLYVLVNTVIQPVFTKNALPKATLRMSEEKKKTGKDDFIEPKDDTISASVKEEVSTTGKDAKEKLYELRKRENLLHARLELASEDSMYLILDLVNNTAILEIKGIMLHECHILHSDISNSIKMYHTDALLNWMAEPFNVKHIDATIPKIQFIEKIAPKDTLEANKMVAEPKMPKLGDVFIVMDFDRNLRLVISQSEQPDDEGKKLITDLKRKYRKIEISRSIQSLTKFNREPVKPQIEIVIPKSDATILYKALPLNPRMIIRM